jgi:hypothetical protein
MPTTEEMAMTRDRLERQRARLEKQRLWQREYRARIRRERIPTHEDLARALLDFALRRYLRQGRHADLDTILDHVARRLMRVGFRREATETVWNELQDSYQRGWSLLRRRCSADELEALFNEDAAAG